MKNKPDGNHHPFCIIKYKKAQQDKICWRCCCQILNSYDLWREYNFVLKDSNKYLKKLKEG